MTRQTFPFTVDPSGLEGAFNAWGCELGFIASGAFGETADFDIVFPRCAVVLPACEVVPPGVAMLGSSVCVCQALPSLVCPAPGTLVLLFEFETVAGTRCLGHSSPIRASTNKTVKPAPIHSFLVLPSPSSPTDRLLVSSPFGLATTEGLGSVYAIGLGGRVLLLPCAPVARASASGAKAAIAAAC